MAKNTVSRVESGNTMETKRKQKRKQVISGDELYAARPRLVRGKDPTPEERYGTLRAGRNPVPQTLATALGAEVDPMETAKEGYRKVARGEAEDPLLSRSAARTMGAVLAGYQGVETVAGASGVGGANTIKPPKPSVSGSPVFIAEHGTSVSALRKILDSRSRSFQNPSVAVRLLDKDQLGIGGGA